MDGLLTGTLAGASICRETRQDIHGWFKAPRGLMARRGLTLTDKALLFALLDFWNRNQRPAWFYVTNAMACQLSCLAPSSLIRARKRLLALKEIETVPGHKRKKIIGRMATRYHLSTKITDELNCSPLTTSTL